MLLKVYNKIRLSVFVFHATTNVCLSNFKKICTKLYVAVFHKKQTF